MDRQKNLASNTDNCDGTKDKEDKVDDSYRRDNHDDDSTNNNDSFDTSGAKDSVRLVNNNPYQAEYSGTVSDDLSDRSQSNDNSSLKMLPNNDNDDIKIRRRRNSKGNRPSPDDRPCHCRESDTNPAYDPHYVTKKHTDTNIGKSSKEFDFLSGSTDLSEKTAIKSSQDKKTAQCSDDSGFIQALCTKLNPLGYLASLRCEPEDDQAPSADRKASSEFEWQQINGKQSSMSGSYGSNTRYTVVASGSEKSSHVSSPKKYGTSKPKRESQRLNRSDGYAKIGYSPRTRTSKIVDFLQKLKRLVLLLLIIAVCSFVLWKIYQSTKDEEFNYLGEIETSSLLGSYKHYAVSTDAKPCAKVGSALLAKGGSAVDAAIGTLLCMGVALPNSLGLGGGCLMTLYDRKQKMATVIDGRETAPDYAHENMFVGDPLSASRGPISVGVPGELSAYWKAHQMYGKLKWSELFDETINLAENGSPTVEHLSHALRDANHAQHISPPLRFLFLNNETGEYIEEGDTFVQKTMAITLRRIRDNGAAELYGGLTGQLFIEDLQKQGGKMTLENLVKYQAIVREPLHYKLADNLQLYTQPPPGSGVVLGIILRIMRELGYYKNLRPSETFEDSSLYYHHLAEAFKFAYAQRAALEDKPDDPNRMEELMKKLISEEFIKQSAGKINNVTHEPTYYGGVHYFQDDHGTAHVSVVDSEGNAAAVTTSVNLYFGSGLYSPRTGIIYNDVMDDFVTPNMSNRFGLQPSKYNRIRPGKRPISSMAPSIFTDNEGNVRLVIGASGGAKITTAIATVSLRNLFLGEDIKSSIDGPRIHHQYLPNAVWYEENFPESLLHTLKERGHSLSKITGRSSVVMAVANDQTSNETRTVTANSDYRKGGTVDGL